MRMEGQSPTYNASLSKAYFAGGCFWCIEADFQKVAGVREVVSGYAGGEKKNPTYEEVSRHTTGHRETVEIHYNQNVVNFRQLVEYFFDHIDPTDTEGQFHDRGASYTSAIFYQDEEERQDAESVMNWLTEHQIYEKPIVTSIIPFKNFFPAEECHQNYAENNTLRYSLYRKASGRDALKQKICKVKFDKKLPLFSGKLKET